MKNYGKNNKFGTLDFRSGNKNSKILGFSIIEVLVAILIFSLGLVSIYAVITSTLKLNDYNKNYIIASNLAREQIELIKNIRDVNFKTIYRYNQKNPKESYTDPDNFFLTGTYYKVENDYSDSAPFSVKVTEINDFGEGEDEISGGEFGKMKYYRLCLDSANKYISVDSSGNCPTGAKETEFFRYLKVDDIVYNSLGTNEIIKNALKLKSKVIWYIRGYHEMEINSVITDFQRL